MVVILIALAPWPTAATALSSGSLAPDLAEALPRLEAAARSGGCGERPAGLSPRLRVDAACRVQVAVVLRGEAARVTERIRAGGGTVTRTGGHPVTLQAWVPPAILRALGADDAVAAVRLPRYVRPVRPSRPGTP